MSMQYRGASKNNKKKRIKVKDVYDFCSAVKEEEYKEKALYDFEEINKLKSLLKYLNDDITYTAKNMDDLLDYFEKIDIFKKGHKRLCELIKHIKVLNIDRKEYDRKACVQENVDEIIKIVESIKNDISVKANESEKMKIEEIEKELDEEYVYAKDIELLKKMILFENNEVNEQYDVYNQVNRISVNIKDKISSTYIPVENGSIEYHDHLNNSIPRLKRLIKNLNKYIIKEDCGKSVYRINQSETLNDSINIAIAIYDNKEYKAISGSNEVLDYCTSPSADEARFESNKVNKRGKLGIGYNRVNDSEKKIFEQIHKLIEEKKIINKGKLVLYSKWEPCPSCYYVIYQFCKLHPDVDIKVKYINSYG